MITRSRAFSSATVVSIGILCSRLFGLVRERVFAHYLGNGIEAGAFRAALRIPNFLQNLFGEGALSASFIPVYSKLLAEGREQDAARLAGITFGILSCLVTLLCVGGVLFADTLTMLLTPGFSGGTRQLTVDLLRVIFPGTGLLVLSAWCLGIQNSHRRFLISYIAPVLWNLGIITALVLGGVLVASSRSPDASADDVRMIFMAYAAAWGTLLGSFLQLAIQIPTTWRLLREGGGFRASLDTTFEPMRRVLRNFLPAVMGRGVGQVSAYIDEILISFLGAGLMSAIGYTQMLYMLPFSLIGTATAAAELPELARAASNSDDTRARILARLESQWGRLQFLLVPAFVGFVALGDHVVGLLFRTGRFGADDVRLVWMLLIAMTTGLLAAAKSRVLVSAFWAQEDTRTPVRVALLRVTLAALAGCFVVFWCRPAFSLTPASAAFWLVLASGVAAWVEYILLRHILTRRLGSLKTRWRAEVMPWVVSLTLAALLSPARHLSLPQALLSLTTLGLYGGLYLALGRLWK